MIKKIILSLVAFVVVVIASFLLYIKFDTVDTAKANEAINTVAPQTTLTSVMTNQKADLVSFRGKYVFLNFWATWCPPCVAEMPFINELYPKYKDKVEFAITSVDTDIEKPTKFIKEKGYTMPVYHADSSLVNKSYSLQGIPTSILINPEGKIAAVHIGGMTKEQLEIFLKQAK